MPSPLTVLRTLDRDERLKAGLLASWFFLVVTTLWLLKPVRNASLLSHLGAGELPYVRLGSVVVVGLVVAGYSRIVGRLSRLQVARGAGVVFAAVLVVFWTALQLGGEALGGQRWFVWSVFILVDVYSTVMIGIFWTYSNDVVSPEEADKLYGPIGLGGIVGGIAGGAAVDSLVGAIGPVHILLACAAITLAGAALVSSIERVLHPRPRPRVASRRHEPGAALRGAREVARSPYLMLIVGIVVGYEFAAAMTDFVVNVVFERAFSDPIELARMFGRLGWIVSVTALVSQILVVPALLPSKRIALLVPPLAMALGTIGLAVLPVVWMAILMSSTDRGLNYSLQQAAKETLYVPLDDAQRYEGKAFIDMFVDRAGKALSAIALVIVIATAGTSIPISLSVALGALVLWAVCGAFLGVAYGAERARLATRAREQLAGSAVGRVDRESAASASGADAEGHA